MSSLKQGSFTLVFVLLTVGALPPSLQGIPDPQPPGYSAQQERERLDAVLRRMNEPDARRERQLHDRLERVLLRYHAVKSTSSREECEALLETMLTLPSPTARAYSLCASAASVLDRPQRAIEIIKKAVAEYPDERIEGPDVPLKISGRYRIGALATRIGDANEATQAYETILGNTDDLKWREVHDSLCCLHLADIACRIAGNNATAAERLRQAMKTLEDATGESHEPQDVLAINLMKDWIRHELWRFEHGKIDPNSAAGSATIHSDGIFLVVTMGALLSCPSQPESEQMAESNRPSIQRDLAGLTLAIDCMHKSNPFRAEGYLRRIAESDSYFKSYARTMLASAHQNMKKIREQIPGLLMDLKAGDEDRRERAAFRLLHECGSEGIEVLLSAQDDPNEHVRYTAACTLANQWLDRAVKARFDIVLDALADDDPRVRRKAQSALGPRSCLDIGSQEIAALIGRLDKAVDQAVQTGIISVLGQMGPAAQDAVPALAKYVRHDDPDVRNAAIRAMKRISPATVDQQKPARSP